VLTAKLVPFNYKASWPQSRNGGDYWKRALPYLMTSTLNAVICLKIENTRNRFDEHSAATLATESTWGCEVLLWEPKDYCVSFCLSVAVIFAPWIALLQARALKPSQKTWYSNAGPVKNAIRFFWEILSSDARLGTMRATCPRFCHMTASVVSGTRRSRVSK
jgi:hypothetical protein